MERLKKHQFYECPSECEKPGVCMFCDGGIEYCTVCKCAEGELPAECPGTPVTERDRKKIQNRELDFKNGVWKYSDESAWKEKTCTE